MFDRGTNEIYLLEGRVRWWENHWHYETGDRWQIGQRLGHRKEKMNPYQKAVLNNTYKDDIKTPQMEFWSILSDSIKYIQHDERTAHILGIKTLD